MVLGFLVELKDRLLLIGADLLQHQLPIDGLHHALGPGDVALLDGDDNTAVDAGQRPLAHQLLAGIAEPDVNEISAARVLHSTLLDQ
jgi:hypothetical protein